MNRATWTLLAAALLATPLGCKDEACPECPTDEGQSGDDDDTSAPDLCGNAEYDGDEQCDAGDLNGASNCRDDCTLVEDMFWEVGSDALGIAMFDAVAVEDDEAPSGDGAWTTSDTDLTLDGVVKLELNLPTDPWTVGDLSLFHEILPPDLPAPGAIGPIPLDQIDAIEYHTRNPVVSTNNVYLVIYTEPDGVDDMGDFFGYQLMAHPHLARNRDEPDDTWVTWSTETYANQLVFADKSVLGVSSGEGLPSLAELTAEDTFNWSTIDPQWPDVDIPYASETLLYVSLQTASGDATIDFDGRFDLLSVMLKDGRSLTLDFEPD